MPNSKQIIEITPISMICIEELRCLGILPNLVI